MNIFFKIFALGLCLLSMGSAQTAVDKLLFPPVPGWKLNIEPQVYVPDNLWDAINGAADLFLEYEFVELRIARYEKNDAYEVKVELYQHRSLVNAFGMYSQERDPGYRFITLGAQGYLATSVLNFIAGPYYVKLTSSKSDPSADKDLLIIGKKIAETLKQPASMPPLLALLPKTGRQKNSEQYVAKSFLGYSFFNEVFTARYGEATPYKTFLLESASATEAQKVLDTYLKSLPQNAVKKQGEDSYRIADPHNGSIVLMLHGKFLCGVQACDDTKQLQKAFDEFKLALKNIK